jgi:hypothetical protein
MARKTPGSSFGLVTALAVCHGCQPIIRDTFAAASVTSGLML